MTQEHIARERVRARWERNITRFERAWIIICVTGTFALALYSFLAFGHL